MVLFLEGANAAGLDVAGGHSGARRLGEIGFEETEMPWTAAEGPLAECRAKLFRQLLSDFVMASVNVGADPEVQIGGPCAPGDGLGQEFGKDARKGAPPSGMDRAEPRAGGVADNDGDAVGGSDGDHAIRRAGHQAVAAGEFGAPGKVDGEGPFAIGVADEDAVALLAKADRWGRGGKLKGGEERLGQPLLASLGATVGDEGSNSGPERGCRGEPNVPERRGDPLRE